MRRTAEKIQYFSKQDEQGQNPFIGFVSYQHFRNEALFSDVRVVPGRRMTETENFECYPIPAGAAQNGRTEGFYPDTTVAYFRILWKDYEPRQGQYCDEMIDTLLARAKENGQTVMLRLMPHSTRACDDVPDWLKEIVVCPERPEGARVKDSPLDPTYLELFGKAIERIAERFDDNPILDTVDICLPGAWGEGHNLHLYSEDVLKYHVDVYTRSFKKTHLLGQVAAPWLVNYANQTRPVGWRGDGTGHGEHMQDIFPRAEAQMADVWKRAPVSFESFYWLGEWERQGWDLDGIIRSTLNWHISTFNAKSFPVPLSWRDKIKYWVDRMGYHFALDYFGYPEAGAALDELQFRFQIDNCGVAPIYREIPLKLRLVNESNCYSFDLPVDIRTWLPGKTENTVLVRLPKNIVPGKYKIELGITDANTPMIYLCTDAPLKKPYYTVGEMEIQDLPVNLESHV